jgi:hypothetical protein
MSRDFQHVLRTADLLLSELERLERRGPAFTIVHSYRIGVDGAGCQVGEEVSRVILASRGEQIDLPLALSTRLLFDYLARTRHVPQNSVQIAAGMRLSAFYRWHGLNTGEVSSRKICRSAIKEYVQRIRQALSVVLQQAALPLNPTHILVSQATSANEVQYQLCASVEWLHIRDLTERHPRIWRRS